MQVEVRVFGGLEKFVPGVRSGQGIPIELPGEATVKALLEKLGIPREQVFSVLVNGRHAATDTPLNHGDRVALLPAVGGG